MRISDWSSDVCSSDLITDWVIGNLDAAIKSLRQAVALDPQESGYHFLLGEVLATAGDFDAARQAQRRALVIDPQNVQAYIALSNLALLQHGDVAAATRILDPMAPGTQEIGRKHACTPVTNEHH